MSLKNKTIVCLDGKIVPTQNRLLHSLKPGVLKAKGVFETMLCHRFKIYAFDEHLKRLKKGLVALNIEWSVDKKNIERLIKSFLKKESFYFARARLSVWEKNGRVHYAIVLQSAGLPKESFKVMISRFRRLKTPTSHLKTLDYAVFYQALQEVQNKNHDEAILLNPQGNIVEGARTNIFFIKNKKLYTPRLSAGCLAGIARKRVLKTAQELNISYRETNCTVGDLCDADEAFVTNAIVGIVPIQKLGESKFYHLGKKTLTKRLQKEYQALLAKTLE